MKANNSGAYKLLQNPVAGKIKKAVEDGKATVYSAFPALAAEENKTKIWLCLFVIVFVFTSVVFLQNGTPGAISSSVDTRTSMKTQEQRNLIRKRDLLIDDLQLRLDREMAKQDHTQKVRGDMEVMQKIVDTKTKIIEELEAQMKAKDLELQIADSTFDSSDRGVSLCRAEAKEAIGKLTSDAVKKNTRYVKMESELKSALTKAKTYKRIVEEKIVQIEALHKKAKSHYQRVNDLQDKVQKQQNNMNIAKATCEEETAEAKDARTCTDEIKALEEKVATLELWKEEHSIDYGRRTAS